MPNIFRATIKEIKFDKGKFTKAMDKALQVQNRAAAREWLIAAAERVPVYTGMARGSFLPLARFLRTHIDVTPVAERPYGSPEKGAALGGFDFPVDPLQSYGFTFSTEVPHFLINEFNVGLGSPPLRNPTPWRSMDAGKAAFVDYWQTEGIYKLPKISEFFAYIRIGSGA